MGKLLENHVKNLLTVQKAMSDENQLKLAITLSILKIPFDLSTFTLPEKIEDPEMEKISHYASLTFNAYPSEIQPWFPKLQVFDIVEKLQLETNAEILPNICTTWGCSKTKRGML